MLRKSLARAVLALAGWKLGGEAPRHAGYVVLGVPHTTNWDFLFIFLTSWGHGTSFHWVGKKELFTLPLLGRVLRWMGGIAIDRSVSKNFVTTMTKLFGTRPGFKLLMSPEGTRKAVDEWKTGFYFIAHNAGVPVVLGYVDYKKKETGLGPVVTLTGDMAGDLQEIYKYYEHVTPLRPENYRSPLKAIAAAGAANDA